MKNELVNLIKSLNQSEKRYFKIFTQPHSITSNRGEKNANRLNRDYLNLYGLLENKEVLNEDEIKESLGKASISPTYLSSLKNYLSKVLMRSLRNFHEELNVERKVTNLLFEAKILEQKRLYNQAIKRLNRADKLARKYEYFTWLLEIINIQKRIIILSQPRHSKKQLLKLNADWVLNLKKIDIQNQIRTIYERCFLISHLKETNEGELDALFHVINQLWEENSATFISVNAKLDYHGFMSFYYLKREEYIERQIYQNATFTLFDQNEHLKQEYFYRYLAAINNYASNCIHLENIDALTEGLSRLTALKGKSLDQRVKIFDNFIYINLIQILSKKEYEKIPKLIKVIKKDLRGYASKITATRRLMFFFNFAQALYILGDDEGWIWIKEANKVKPKTLRTDIRLRVRVLEVLYHFEQENYLLTEHLIDSAIHFVKEHRSANQEELITLRGIKRIIAEPFNRVKLIEQLKTKTEFILEWAELEHWVGKIQ